MIRCLCIDDAGRPSEIPQERWPVKDHEYHITFIAFCKPQLVSGCNLHELYLEETNHPYLYYRLTRFAIHKEDWDAFIQLCNDCTDLDGLVVEQLIEELHLETV